MRGEPEDEGNESSEEEEEQPKPKKKPAAKRKSKYKESSSESELTEDSEEDEAAPEEEAEENDDDIEIPPFDESTMGPRGGPFTKSGYIILLRDCTHRATGDLGVVARHVASFPDFIELSMQDRWADFARRVSTACL